MIVTIFDKIIASSVFQNLGELMSVTMHPQVNAFPSPCYKFNLLPYMAKGLTTVGFIKELSALTGIHPADLPPLDNYIDTDTFNRSLAPDSAFNTMSLSGFRFAYGDYDVIVESDGTIQIFE